MKKKPILEKENLINVLETFFKKNAGIYTIKMVFLYGSWAGDLQRLDSDVDIAVLFSKEFSDDMMFEKITDVSLALSVEIDMDVNVMHIHTDFREPMLYYNAIVLGEPVFFDDFTEYVDLRNEAIYQMEDFSIFGIDWQRDVAKNNLREIKRV